MDVGHTKEVVVAVVVSMFPAYVVCSALLRKANQHVWPTSRMPADLRWLPTMGDDGVCLDGMEIKDQNKDNFGLD